MLLSRVADQLFWAARYLERAECTARIVRTFTEVIVDLPRGLNLSWEPLLAISGNREAFDAAHARTSESDIVRFLVADTANTSSVIGGHRGEPGEHAHDARGLPARGVAGGQRPVPVHAEQR